MIEADSNEVDLLSTSKDETVTESEASLNQAQPQPRSKEESSYTTSNSSPSIDKKFTCLRQQHLHTINEGNSSEVSISQQDCSSLIMRESISQQSGSAQYSKDNVLEKATLHRLKERQS